MFRTGTLALLAVLIVSPLANADRATSSVTDVAVIQNGEGAARVLFRCPEMIAADGIAIRRATLTIPVVGLGEARALHLQLHPVTANWNARAVDWTTSWSRPGGDFDDELYTRTRVDLASGATTASLDVTMLVKEIVEAGMTADGFILSVVPHEGEGIRVEDLPRLAALAGASLAVSYVKVPAIDRRRG
jgi:hypothetical protein